MIWFTSDQHFGHSNIIRFCNRPFKDCEEMNEVLIDNHNHRVKDGDDVYHLGDFTFQLDAERYLLRMNGKHHLILGNHDHNTYHKRKRPGVYTSIQDIKQVKWCGHTFFLSHYSHRVWPKSHFGAFHLYGHSHDSIPAFGRSMDVGVDTNNFYPYSGEEIVQLLSGVDHLQVDHHYKAFKDCK